ncbi:hypothetical protein Gobs01_00192 [Geodermatophilus obscurus DSM 43160]
MAVAPDVRTRLLDGSSLHLGSPASSRPPEFPPHGVRVDVHRLGVRTARA